MTQKTLSRLAGVSYIIIFFTAIFANFFVLDGLKASPLEFAMASPMYVRLGVLAFLVAALFDIVIAWALYQLYREHELTMLSTLLRLAHAVLMGAAVFTLLPILAATSDAGVLAQVSSFDNLWLIGLFFFGFHLLLLPHIIRLPRFIAIFLTLAGIMYPVDTIAHFLMPDYTSYASIFLAMVAVPSILGEMVFGIWLLVAKPKS